MSEFSWQVRVYYEDTDSGGVVYHANYLCFMERARTEWLRALGFEQDRLRRDEGVLFAVRSAQVEYRRPARFNDRLDVSARLVARRGASLEFEQAVRRTGEDGEPLCTGRVRVACLAADTLVPAPIPGALLEALTDVD